MKRDFRVYLDDILESILYIEAYTENLTKQGFKNDIGKQDAVVRRLEIIGEAVKHIPEEIKKDHREIPWNKITGARNIFVHEYFGVKLERVWDTIKQDLPRFKEQIEKLLKELEPEK